MTAATQDTIEINDRFQHALRLMEETDHCLFITGKAGTGILSAEYGLVDPEQVISPYEKTLNTMPIVARRQWAEKVGTQLGKTMPQLKRAVFLAGSRYREFLGDHLQHRGIIVEVPMEGLRIGEQLNWLARHI